MAILDIYLKGRLTIQCMYIYTSQAGTDHTGEVSGAYYMRYLNMTFNDALYIDNHVQDRDM